MDTLTAAESASETPVSTEPAGLEEILEERAAAREAVSADNVEQEEIGENEELVTDSDQEEHTDETPSDDSVELDEPVNDDEDTVEIEATEESTSIEPPQFWDAEGKEHWSQIDPVTQAFVVAQDKKAQAFVTKAQAKAKQEALSEVSGIIRQNRTKLEQFDSAIDMAENMFNESHATDAQLVELMNNGQITPEDAMRHQVKRAEAKSSLEDMRKARDEELNLAVQQNITHRNKILEENENNILGDAEDVVKFLFARGVTQDRIDLADASEIEMAWAAMQYFKGQDAAKKLKPPRKAPAKVIPPKAKSKRVGNPQSQRIASLKVKADASGAMEDILAHREAVRAAQRKKKIGV
jgi:hypothetical protein